MGLGSMRVLSDNEGLAIRGMGTSASVWGESTANFLGQTSTNGYWASASHWHGSSSAKGKNFSFAGIVHIEVGDPDGGNNLPTLNGTNNHNGGSGFSLRAVLGVAGGFSSAYAR